MEVPRFEFDFSFLDLSELADICISSQEVQDLFYSPLVRTFDYTRTDGFGYCIGYSAKNKFVSFIFEFNDQMLRITNVWLSDEPEIRTRYYKR
jgi:hypothetical protein